MTPNGQIAISLDTAANREPHPRGNPVLAHACRNEIASAKVNVSALPCIYASMHGNI